jgi:HAD superfamily hydrolase (TIGR01509 family)
MPMTPNRPNNNPAAVVFDLDGLLIDTEWAFAEAARRVLARRGLELEPAFFATMMGTPARDALPRFRDHYRLSESIDALAAEYRADFTALFPEHPPRLMPGAAALMERLELARKPKAIATSSSRQYVDGVFGPLGLIDRFAFVLTSDDVTHGKPHPEVYALAAKRLELPASSVVVLEDSLNGVRAAKAAGCSCVAVPHENQPKHEYAIADLIARSLDDPALMVFLGV